MQFDILNSSSTLTQPHHIIIIHTDFRLDSPPMMMTPQETSIHHIRECIRRTQILHKYSHTLWIVSGFSASITHMDYGYGWQGALVVCQRLVFLLADGSMAMLLNVKQEKKNQQKSCWSETKHALRTISYCFDHYFGTFTIAQHKWIVQKKKKKKKTCWAAIFGEQIYCVSSYVEILL